MGDARLRGLAGGPPPQRVPVPGGMRSKGVSALLPVGRPCWPRLLRRRGPALPPPAASEPATPVARTPRWVALPCFTSSSSCSASAGLSRPPPAPPPPQVVLTCFNIMLLALSLMNRSKRRSEASAADAKGAAKLAPSSRLRPGADGVVDGAIKAAPGGSVEGSAVRLRARAV